MAIECILVRLALVVELEGAEMLCGFIYLSLFYLNLFYYISVLCPI